MTAFPSPDWTHDFKCPEDLETDFGIKVDESMSPAVWHNRGRDSMRIDLTFFPKISIEVWNGRNPKAEMKKILEEKSI
jgi:hypothetical protein